MQFFKHNRFAKATAMVAVLVAGGLMTGCKRSPDEKIEKIGSKISSYLDFSEQQDQILKEITAELKTDFATERAYRKSMATEVETLLMAENLDTSRVKQIIEERNARMNQKVDKYLTKVAALHKTLTPEQKKEILEKLQKLQKYME